MAHPLLLPIATPMSRPARVAGFSYQGFQRYFVTLCTHRRTQVFVTSGVVDTVLAQILRSASALRFVVVAYCFMPDHVHLLIEGVDEAADFKSLVSICKQKTGFVYRRRIGRSLWQTGYHERVLRNADETSRIVRYILLNPVRAGFVDDPRDYPWSGGCRAWLQPRRTEDT